MFYRQNIIIRISVILSLLFQLVFTSVQNDLNYKQDLDNIRILQQLDPELQNKIEEVAKNSAYADPGFCSIKNLTKLNTIKLDDIVAPLNTELTVEESIRFVKYFQDEYISNTTILEAVKNDLSPVKTNYISLANNEFDDYITVVYSELKHENQTRIKTYFTTKKQNIVRNEKWIYDFEIKDDFGFCYYCNNDALKPQVCKIHLKAKTWGARNTIELTENVYKAMMESDEFNVLISKIEGGPMSMRSHFYTLILCLYCCIPLISYTININYLYKIDRSKDRRLSGIGYCISCCTVNSYHLYILISFGVLNVNENSDVIPMLIFIFFAIAWLGCVFFYPILANGEEKHGEPDFEPTFVSLHCAFYIITIPLVCTVFAPFMLYDVYMSPTMYFMLGSIYIIPIVISAVGRATVNDHYMTILLNGVYFGLFPLMKTGPGFWMDDYTFTWFCSFMLTQIIYAIIVGLQQTKGSRFFCPSKYRRYTYFRFKHDLDTSPLDESVCCSLCLNSIHEVELEYKDINKNYKYKDFGSNCYLKLECAHIFHPNCLIRRIEHKNECPVCQCKLPPYGFDD